MRPFHVALLALALLAGGAGYLVERFASRPAAPARLGPADGAVPAATAAADADGTPPLDWTFADLKGHQVSLKRWRGRLLVVNFWATWCPPCRHEIPTFIELQKRYGSRGLQFLGIALDQRDAVAPFVASHGVNYPVLIGDEDVVQFMQALGNPVGGLPYTVVIGRDGKVEKTHEGEWHAQAVEQTLRGLLGGG